MHEVLEQIYSARKIECVVRNEAVDTPENTVTRSSRDSSPKADLWQTSKQEDQARMSRQPHSDPIARAAVPSYRRASMAAAYETNYFSSSSLPESVETRFGEIQRQKNFTNVNMLKFMLNLFAALDLRALLLSCRTK